MYLVEEMMCVFALILSYIVFLSHTEKSHQELEILPNIYISSYVDESYSISQNMIYAKSVWFL